MPLSRINNNSIADGTIIASDILDGTISSSKLVASNIAGDRLAANTLANSVFQTGSVENYMRAQGVTSSFAGMRNRIINGDMRIDQRNAGASVSNLSGALTWSVDRWRTNASAASKFTLQRDSSANTVAGFTSSLKLTSSSAYTSGSSDYFYLGQAIEGQNIADLAWGTANAKTVTLSFWVRASVTGTYGGIILNSDGTANYPYSFTVVAANTWEQKIITIPGPTFGTWATDNSTGIEVRFDLGNGSTYTTGTAGVWSASFGYPSGTVKLVATNASTLYITGLQFEAGSTATPFEFRHFTTELQLCQRYYEQYSNGNTTSSIYEGLGGQFPNTTLARSAVPFKVTKRAVPTMTVPTTYVTINSIAGDKTPSSAGSNFATTEGASLGFDITGVTGGYACSIGISSSNPVKISAEL
jgi:hypothetical protein